MQLEHGTIPPYLTALYSLHPGTQLRTPCHILRVVAVEEMLHLTLVANMLNAVGGEPDLTQPGLRARLPGATCPTARPTSRSAASVLPGRRRDVPARSSGRDEAPSEERRLAPRSRAPAPSRLARPGRAEHAVLQHRRVLRGDRPRDRPVCTRSRATTLFSGDPARQVTPEYYYSGGGELIPVTDLDSARAGDPAHRRAGRGPAAAASTTPSTSSPHYYRFEQLLLGRYYQQGDKPGKPTGPPLQVDWDAVYPVKKNAKLADYPSRLGAARRGRRVQPALRRLPRVTHRRRSTARRSC